AVLAADYWSIGPCFATPTKRDAGPPLGPDGFGAIARLAPEGMPVIGIGGITAANARQMVDAGATGVAVIGAVLSAANPESAARAVAAAALA
ncbi:MAG: thiamine phosphate synthase, partial [Myxococcales bacterium]